MKNRILCFTDSLGAGGAQRQLVGLAVLLQRNGYQVKVCTYHNLDFYKSFLQENNIPNDLIPNANSSRRRIKAVSKYFNQENPDWVIAYQETPSLVACVAKLLGCKFRLIVSERNTTQCIGIKERIRFFLYHWADAIVPNSFAQEKFLTMHYPWMQKKLTTISNFVDLEHFNFKIKDKRRVPEIAVVASIWDAKNTLGYIDAIKLLADKGYKLHTSWYGKNDSNIDYYNLCTAKINNYSIQDYIALNEKTKQIKQVYQEADFFCLPSFYEGTPNVICEAMSCGRPIICSAVCDNPMYVEEGENGFLFDPMSPETIADAIERAITISNDEYFLLCKNSRKKSERLFSEMSFIQKYIKIIES